MADKIEIEVEKKDYDYPEFDIPAGLDLSDIEEGEEKEVLAKIRRKGDGTLCLVEVDGYPLKKEDDDYAEEQVDDEVEEDFVSGVRARAAQSGLI